ncbi:DUF4468 domain-containing protein [Adhaeribacter rhizoryzae]|uniref:DUF4468 domain-containing protein n=1 Tax=Adhaeribacter rhizoryzae TaxID=2607907 RepID=A0A5M6DNE7_9BACT|nr:DUF4468 domain-containing protein [Adhaeribacter rhizoryzae]KAA5547772.1 DUF4468 domain-containing protein [Adhaeribacter rhizoryzae]
MQKLLFLLLLLPFSLLAQPATTLPTDAATGRFVVTDLVTVPGLSQQDLHDKAQQYLTKSFKAPSSVIQEDNADKIVFKGFRKLNVKTDDINTNYPLHYILTITFEEGAYRFIATDFSPDAINYYTPQSLKHPDQLKFKNKKEKQAYLTVYNTYINGMQNVGKDLQTAIKRSLVAKAPVKRR